MKVRDAVETLDHPTQPGHQVGLSAQDGKQLVGQAGGHALDVAEQGEVQKSRRLSGEPALVGEPCIPGLDLVFDAGQS